MFATVWGPPFMRPKLPPLWLPEPLYELIHNGWHYDPQQRPSMPDMEETLYQKCKKFRGATFPESFHHPQSRPRRKSKVIYDKEKQVFRVNSMLVLEEGQK